MPKRSTQSHVQTWVLPALLKTCPVCEHPMRPRYYNRRHVLTLRTLLNLRLQIVRCENAHCSQYQKPYRPPLETRIALPYTKFAFDVLAITLWLFKIAHLTVREIRAKVSSKLKDDYSISLRGVRNLIALYERRCQGVPADHSPTKDRISAHGFVGLDLYCAKGPRHRPILWVLRDCISGHVFTIHFVESDWLAELSPILSAVLRHLECDLNVRIAGIMSNGGDRVHHLLKESHPEIERAMTAPVTTDWNYLHCDFSHEFQLDPASQKEVSDFLMRS